MSRNEEDGVEQPTDEPQAIGQIVITLFNNGNLSAEVRNVEKLPALGMLEYAKQVIFAPQQDERRVMPVRLMPGRRM